MVHAGKVLDRYRISWGQERAFEELLKRQDEMVAQAETGQPWRSFAKLELVVPEEGANTRSIGWIF